MIEEELRDNGYAVLSLLSKEDVGNLDLLFKQFHPNSNQGFFATMFHKDLKVKLSVSRGIAKILEAKSAELMPRHTCLFANFLVKAPNSDHQVGIHQDWSYLDESKFTSYNIWGSIGETTVNNGGLWVLPKSHKFKNPYRGTPFEDGLYNLNEEKIKRNAVFIPTAPGEVIIYNSRLIHYSLPNQSNSPRIAFAGIMIPKNSKPLHYFKKGDKLLQYAVNELFFCNLIPDQEPKDQFKKELSTWYRPNSMDLSNFILSLEKDGKQ